MTRPSPCHAAATLAFGALFAPLVAAQTPTPAPTPADCSTLATLAIPNTNLLSAAVVPAQGDLPEYCRVLGYVRPAINFEVRLPTRGWNGKFYMAGCGGFCGTVDSDRPGFTNAMNHGLRRNYAVSTMDSGHWGLSSVDARWAWNNRQAELDWGQRAVTETARVTKLLIRTFYGREQAKSYFAGCSTGGRMAQMEAWRYPADFDGIISGAPALDYPGLVATQFAWLVQANTGADGKEIFARRKFRPVADAVLAACDAKDGQRDGLIDDPRACDFNPAALQCQGADADHCLTAAEVGVLEKWYLGPRNARGEALYPGGIPPGSEPYWPLWLSGNPANQNPALITLFGADFLRYMAFAEDPGEGYSALRFDFERDPQRLAPMQAIYNSDNPDLTRFRDRGGRLLMYHGWADAIVTPYKTIDYVERVTRAMGGPERTAEFLRLYMVPGFDHCGAQQGPGVADTGFDLLTALENWVEKGQPPTSIVMTRRDAGAQPLWSRPLCPYPQRARLVGSGDPKDAASYACTNP